MFERKRTLRAQIATYEAALKSIAAKPQERLQLLAHVPQDPENADSAYGNCAKIATIALWAHHPEMRAEAERKGRERTQRVIEAQAAMKR